MLEAKKVDLLPHRGTVFYFIVTEASMPFVVEGVGDFSFYCCEVNDFKFWLAVFYFWNPLQSELRHFSSNRQGWFSMMRCSVIDVRTTEVFFVDGS